MKNIRRVGATVCLTFVLSISAFADNKLTPPCAPPEPGIVQTPPCFEVGQISAPSDEAALGQTETLPSSSAIAMRSIAEAALNLLLLF